VIEILALSTRRGPAAEAQALYRDLDPPQAQARKDPTLTPAKPAQRDPGAGRPTKRERRMTDRLKPEPDDPTL
jgi:ribosome-associated heat shock protein Hsp15